MPANITNVITHRMMFDLLWFTANLLIKFIFYFKKNISKVEVTLEIGHRAIPKLKKTEDDHTHDWYVLSYKLRLELHFLRHSFPE